ncbi:MAG: Crp/Fnr family transcriptional regulator [Bacteroidota bacterium]|uniref:Crp/Fnr family transcriptional regulator n=1 Tax=Runella sp. TaxID=1960881 RepID=UPI0030164A07
MSEISLHPPKSVPAKARGSKPPEQEIIDYISKFIALSDTEIRAILENINIRNFKKGAVLLREGQVSSLCYFILKGCVRQYYLKDGEEKTTNFYTEGQPVPPYEGTFKKKPSKFYLACVEDTMLSVGTPADEAKLFAMFPHFEAVTRVAVEDELGKSQENMASFMINSPEERYQNLLETRPDLLDRVPQYQLASYLGITPESLSRIRKRIMRK